MFALKSLKNKHHLDVNSSDSGLIFNQPINERPVLARQWSIFPNHDEYTNNAFICVCMYICLTLGPHKHNASR